MKMHAARRHALSLPDTVEQPHHESTSFRVGGRIFATAPPDGAHLHLFIPDLEREQALELHDFTEKLFWGGKVVGIRVRLAEAEPAVVRKLLEAAWRHKAPAKAKA